LLEATLISGEPMTLAVGGRAHALCRGPALRVLTA
jgi:hypothetical protein